MNIVGLASKYGYVFRGFLIGYEAVINWLVVVKCSHRHERIVILMEKKLETNIYEITLYEILVA